LRPLCGQRDRFLGLELQIPRQQLVDAVDRVRGDALEQFSQVSIRIDAVKQARADQAVDVGGALAAMYSLMETAKLNGIDPEAYLRHVLARLPDHPIKSVVELLPWNVALEQAREERLAA
jgi:hypothetical protein